MPLEVEQKFRLTDPERTKFRLAELGIALGEPVRQVDTYFRHPSRNFRQTDEAFRVRQIGDENFVTYKGPKLDMTTKTRRELELPLPTGVTYAAEYQRLLAALGFVLGGIVSKWRRHGHAIIDGQDVDVAWDDVDDLGTFMELEIVTDEGQLEAARKAVYTVAARLELSGGERRSYLELLENQSR